MAKERLIEVILHSASNLKDVNYLSKMETFAVLSFLPYVNYTTNVDSSGGLNPTWNEKLEFRIPEVVLKKADGHLKLEIFTSSTFGPKFVSEASIPLLDISLLPPQNEPILKKFPLKTNSGDFQGYVTISFKVGDMVPLKSSDKESSYPFVSSFDTSHPTHVTTLHPHGTLLSTPSKPIPSMIQPTPPPPPSPPPPPPSHVSPYDQGILTQTPTMAQKVPLRAYGVRPLTRPPFDKEYDYLPQSTTPPPPPPPLGKPYANMPIPQPTAYPFPVLPNYGEADRRPHVEISSTRDSILHTKPPPFSQPPPKVGLTQGLVTIPVTLGDEVGYGHVTSNVPTQSTNLLFEGPLGKLLLSDLNYKKKLFGHAY